MSGDDLHGSAAYREALRRGNASLRRQMARAYLSAFCIVSLVTAATYVVAHGMTLWAMAIQVGVAFCWIENVRSAAFGSWWVRSAYMIGSVCGSGFGMVTSKWLAGVYG